MIAHALLLVFPAAMALAACFDLTTMTIPNRLVIGFAGLFPLAALAAGLPLETIGLHLAAGVAMLVVGFALFSFGWVGGGDAKFLAATALWLGWGPLLEYALAFSLLGGALTLLILFARAVPLPLALGRRDWILRLHNPNSGIPYGIALAVAGLVVYPDTAWIAAFLP